MNKPDKPVLAVYDGLTVGQKAVTDYLLCAANAKGFAAGLCTAGIIAGATMVVCWAGDKIKERKWKKLFQKDAKKK